MRCGSLLVPWSGKSWGWEGLGTILLHTVPKIEKIKKNENAKGYKKKTPQRSPVLETSPHRSCDPTVHV